MGNVDVWSKILFTFDHQSWNSTTQLTVLGSKHYVKRLLAIFHSPYFFRVPSSSPRFYVKNLLSFMSPIWNKIIWKVSRVGSNRRLFTTGKHKENYRKNIQPGRSRLYSIWCCCPAFYLQKWLTTPWNSCWEQEFFERVIGKKRNDIIQL